METGKDWCGCFYKEDNLCQEHGSYVKYTYCQEHHSSSVRYLIFHFCHLQKSLQHTDTSFVREKSGDIFAVLKGAPLGSGEGWELIPVLKNEYCTREYQEKRYPWR